MGSKVEFYERLMIVEETKKGLVAKTPRARKLRSRYLETGDSTIRRVEVKTAVKK